MNSSPLSSHSSRHNWQPDSPPDPQLSLQLNKIKKERGIELKAILAQSLNGVIGHKGRLPWHESADLKFFKQCTMDSWLIMGRRTYQSFASPLQRRHFMVISRNKKLALPEAVSRATGPLEALEKLPHDQSVFVVGGADIYDCFFCACDEIFLTLIKELHVGDTFFNAFARLSADSWSLVERQELSRSAELYHFKSKQA